MFWLWHHYILFHSNLICVCTCIVISLHSNLICVCTCIVYIFNCQISLLKVINGQNMYLWLVYVTVTCVYMYMCTCVCVCACVFPCTVYMCAHTMYIRIGMYLLIVCILANKFQGWGGKCDQKWNPDECVCTSVVLVNYNQEPCYS